MSMTCKEDKLSVRQNATHTLFTGLPFLVDFQHSLRQLTLIFPDCSLNSEVPVVPAIGCSSPCSHTLQVSLSFGFTRLRSRHSRTFLSIPAHSWRQVSADTVPFWVTGIWGNFSIVDLLPEERGPPRAPGRGEGAGSSRRALLGVSGAGTSLTSMASESEPFHLDQFVFLL